MNNEEMTREEIHELGIKRQRVADRLIKHHILSSGCEMSWLVKYQYEMSNKMLPIECEIQPYHEDSEGYIREVLQWWHITNSLAEELRKKDECVVYVDDWDKWYWGRTCCGQALSLDWVLQEIAVEWFGLD